MARRVSGRLFVAVAVLALVGAAGLWASGGTETATARPAGVTMAPGPWGKYTPGIEITSVYPPNPPERMGDGDTDANNPWTRAYKDLFGITVKPLWVSDDYTTKTNLMIASGDLADFFRTNAVQFAQLVEAGLLQPLDEAWKYASPDSIGVVEGEAGPMPKRAATVGGKLMAIPWTLMRENTPMIWLRTDWLEKLGMARPKTMQDLISIAEAFVKKDPDGDGKDDTIGLLFTKNLYDLWGKGFFNSYHAYPQIWIKDASGKLAYGSVQPQMKTALAELQRMYKQGLLDKEWAVLDPGKVAEAVAAGRCGLHFGEFHSVNQSARDNDPKCEFASLPMVSPDGAPAKAQLGDLINGYFVVRKGYPYPEAMVKLLNMWMEYFYFTKDDAIFKQYNQGPKGTGMWQSSLIFAYRGYKNLANAEAVRNVTNGSMTLQQINPEQRGVYAKVQDFLVNKNQKEWRYTNIFGPNASMFVVDYYRKNNLQVENEFYTSATPTMAQNWSTLEAKAIEVYTKIIMGDPISEFDKFVETWNSLGGAKITQEVNDWYSKR
jgi:putative aldouronate transport system substrate-binding protein